MSIIGRRRDRAEAGLKTHWPNPLTVRTSDLGCANPYLNMLSTETVFDMDIRSATNKDKARIRALVFRVLAEHGWCGDSGNIDADLEDVETNYIQRGGLFEIIEDRRGNLMGTVGLYRLNAETCELRK